MPVGVGVVAVSPGYQGRPRTQGTVEYRKEACRLRICRESPCGHEGTALVDDQGAAARTMPAVPAGGSAQMTFHRESAQPLTAHRRGASERMEARRAKTRQLYRRGLVHDSRTEGLAQGAIRPKV